MEAAAALAYRQQQTTADTPGRRSFHVDVNPAAGLTSNTAFFLYFRYHTAPNAIHFMTYNLQAASVHMGAGPSGYPQTDGFT